MADDLSPTKLGMLERCGLQYEFRYVKGLKLPPSSPLIVGSAAHRAAELDLKRKMEAGELLGARRRAARRG